MNKPQDYIAKADGWIAGKWCAKGTPLQMTAHAAKYEQVTLVSAEDDPEAVKSPPRKPAAPKSRANRK